MKIAMRIAICGVLLVGCTMSAWAAKASAKARDKAAAKTETLTCRLGTEDRHARIGVVLVGGVVDSFAYYSKWKPRTCSIYLQRRGDTYSKWRDKGNITTISLERGLFLVEHKKGEYRFLFRDVDRERYCGMDGVINGSLTIRKGSEQCELAGVMEEGVPLGQAVAHMEQSRAAARGASTSVVSAPAASASPASASVFSAFTAAIRREPEAPRRRYYHQPLSSEAAISD